VINDGTMTTTTGTQYKLRNAVVVTCAIVLWNSNTDIITCILFLCEVYVVVYHYHLLCYVLQHILDCHGINLHLLWHACHQLIPSPWSQSLGMR